MKDRCENLPTLQVQSWSKARAKKKNMKEAIYIVYVSSQETTMKTHDNKETRRPNCINV